MFVKNAWYVVAWSSEVTTEKLLARKILGVPLVIYRTALSRVNVLEDKCCHRGLPLSMGRVHGESLKCGYHGLEFAPDGRCIMIPGQASIPPNMKVRSFPVVEKDKLIWMWAGDNAMADPELVPHFPWHNDPAWPFLPYWQHINCGYQLVIDNLLDQTHLAYVHGNTIGGNLQGHASAEMEVVATPRGMRFMRWLPAAVPPPSYVEAKIGISADDKVDRWAEFEYVAPITVLQYVGGLPVRFNAKQSGIREGGWALRIMHNITPETETSCHYFWGGCHGFCQDDPTVTIWMRDQIQKTFYEDEVILEAQQQRLIELPGPLTATKHDRPRIFAERALIKMLKDEQR
jgi:phenylpropionate dioxygenase-like ring-hydroxylating dioxygenase large terminal subunit